MIMYHGTTYTLAQRIKTEGLKPNPSRDFVFMRDEPFSPIVRTSEVESEPTVYLTPKEMTAIAYAAFRARYERAKYKEPVTWSPEVNMIKLARYRELSAKPAIVVFNLPESFESQLQEDYDSPNYSRAYLCHCAIPPEYVTDVKITEDKIFSSSDFRRAEPNVSFND